MKIAYIVPGSGGSFYCGNCFRDSSFLTALKKSEHEIIIVPMYLPLTTENGGVEGSTPIFYGAVNMYLKQISPIFKKMPAFLQKYLDSNQVLNFAAKRSGSTRATGLEEMTISMLKGDKGNQAAELEIMMDWFRQHIKPNVIHLSNALLLGLAPRFKKELSVTVVCSLQDEDEWLDEMSEKYQKESWDLISQNAAYVDKFIAVSNYYANMITDKINLSPTKIKVIYNGVDFNNYHPNRPQVMHHTIGFISKMNHLFGLDILVDAFIILKKDERFKELKLKATGGYSPDDKLFIQKQITKLQKAKISGDVEFIKEFNGDVKIDFFNSISILSVPAIRKEAFGMYLLEAFASGIPVVQPDYGAYTEVVNAVGGGILYSPNTPEMLADSLLNLITNEQKYIHLKEEALKGINPNFGIQRQVSQLLEIYKSEMK